MSADYLKMTAETLIVLPRNKQAEVYDFAQFLRESTKPSSTKRNSKKGSILSLNGIGATGLKDISLNHDKYLYE